MTFTPPRSAISDITRAIPTVVTTSDDHGLITGNIVRLHVPKNYGMVELNQLAVSVTVLSTTTFSCQYSQIPPGVNVDSRNFTAFTIPSDPSFTAEVLCIGSGPTPPNDVDWQSLSGFCESTVEDAELNNSTVPIPF
jgi:hypothetical protein